jgi:hypothetical protein
MSAPCTKIGLDTGPASRRGAGIGVGLGGARRSRPPRAAADKPAGPMRKGTARTARG